MKSKLILFSHHTFLFLFMLTGTLVHAQTTHYGSHAGGLGGPTNSFFGYYAGHKNASNGYYNTYVGTFSGRHGGTGDSNSFFGYQSGQTASIGSKNSFFGAGSGFSSSTGSGNTFLGVNAGYRNTTGSLNIFIGLGAGYSETGSNKLFIDNSGTSSPLIWGDFSIDQVKINGTFLTTGNVGVGTTSPAYKLHTLGDIYAEGGWMRVSGKSGIYFQSYGGGFHMIDNTWIRTYGNKSFYHKSGTMRTDGTFQVGPNGNRFVVEGNGNIGMGTSPSYKLHTKGDIYADGGWMRVSGNKGIYFESRGGGFHMTDNTWIRTYGNKNFYVLGTIKLSGNLRRTSHHTGHLEGSYINVGNNSTKSNPIYTIGSSYNPGDATLGNMYGVGFTHANASFLNSTDLGINPTSGWGAYFASDGNARIFLNAGNGDGYFKGHIYGQSVTVRGATNLDGGVKGGGANHSLRVINQYGSTDIGPQNTSWSHFTTDRPRFWFSKGITVDQGLVGSYNEDLQLQVSGTTALTISNADKRVSVKNNLMVNGNLQLNRSNIQKDDNVEDLMVLKGDGTLALRDVRSIESPWLLDVFANDKANVACNPEVIGSLLVDIFDLNGNLRIGDNSYIDDDMDMGDNDGAPDDWMKFSDRIEFKSSADKYGIVLYDKSSYLQFLNLHHSNGSSFFSNGNDADNYFLKATGSNVDVHGKLGVGLDGSSSPTQSLDVAGTARLRGLAENSLVDQLLVTDTDGVVYQRNLETISPWKKYAHGNYHTESQLGIGVENTSKHISTLITTNRSKGLVVNLTNSIAGSSAITSTVAAEDITAYSAFNSTSGNEVFRVYGNGIIEAKELLVSLDIWNDHVFKKGYDLMPLEQVEKFVKENHHLPEIPSEKEVLEEGVKVGEMEALLLKKIEELTLYIIDQNKQLKTQAEQLNKQAERIEALQKSISDQ